MDPSLVKPQPHLSTYGVLKETIKTTRRNGRLAISILLFVFLSTSQLKLGSRLALRPLLKDLSSSYWPVQEKVTSCETRSKVLAESFRPSPWVNRNIYYSYQRANPSSYKGHTGQTKIVRNSKSAYPYQGAYPSSYNDHTGQTKQVRNSKSAYSYQRTNPISNGYKDQTKPMGMKNGAYSYLQTNASSNSYKVEIKGKGELKDVRAILGVYLLILAVSCVIFLFFFVSTIYSSYEAYTAKVITLKEVFLKFRESWKRAIHTGIYLTLINSGSFVLLTCFVELISFFAKGPTAYVLYAILFVPGYICYIHLAALWRMSFVVSVLESDYSGLKAIVRAGDLMKGKRRQAYLMIVFFNLVNASVNTISYAYSRKLNKWAKMNISKTFVIGLVCVIKLLLFVAFTIYYHERKMNEEEKVEGRQGLYVPIASDEV